MEEEVFEEFWNNWCVDWGWLVKERVLICINGWFEVGEKFIVFVEIFLEIFSRISILLV